MRNKKKKRYSFILIILVLLVLVSIFFIFSNKILCNYFGINCGKYFKGELGSAGPLAVQGSCKDGIDNDGDGKIDWPNDEGCLNADDDNEYGEPIGYLDKVENCNNIIGWTCDPDDFNAVVDVHLYKDGPVGAGGSLLAIVKANVQRESAVGNLCGGNSTHGFSFPLPNSLKDGKQQKIYAYGINLGTPANNVELKGTPITFSCIGGNEKKPNLVIKSISLDYSENGPGGVPGYTYIVYIKNIGDAPVSTSYLRTIITPKQTQRINIGNGTKDYVLYGGSTSQIPEVFGNLLQPEQEGRYIDYINPSKEGSITIEAIADYSNVISESNEEDNSKKEVFYVKKVFDTNICTDSDAGKNYDVVGDTCIGTDCKKDVCGDSNILMEYSCSNNDRISEEYKCPNGCKDGACVKCTKVCKNIDTRSQGWYDSCTGELIFYDSRCGKDLCVVVDSVSKEISEGEGIYVGGLTIHLNSADEKDTKLSASIKIDDKDFTLTSSSPSVIVSYTGFSYNVELVSATDSSANIKVSVSHCPLPEGQVCKDLIEKAIDLTNIAPSVFRSDYYNYPMTKYSFSYDEDLFYLGYDISVFDDKDFSAIDLLQSIIDYRICTVKGVKVNNVKNKIYVCSVGYGEKYILWAKDNVVVERHISPKDFYYTDKIIEKISNEKIGDFLSNLKDNKGEPIDPKYFDIDSILEIIKKDLSLCSSGIPEDVCVPKWECKTEPLICPPHGTQEVICRDVNECSFENVYVPRYNKECNPGICSGCYIPRNYYYSDNNNQYDYYANLEDRKCIPYGTRLQVSEGDVNTISEIEFNSEDNFLNLKINSDNSFEMVVTSDNNIIKEINVNGKTFYFKKGEKFIGKKGDTYNIRIVYVGYEELVENYDLTILDVYYSKDYGKYITYRFNKNYNFYCDPFIGGLSSQKVKDSQGNWAKCQNNYECESNVCSSGECVDVKGAIKEAGRIKTLFYRVLCRLSALFSDSKYEQCLLDNLGESSNRNLGPPPLP